MSAFSVLDTTDYLGRRVVLSRERWKNIIRNHPEIEHALVPLEAVLKQPTVVREFVNGRSVNFYFGRLPAAGTYPLSYLGIVVENDRDPGQLLTAYVTAQPTGLFGRVIHVGSPC